MCIIAIYSSYSKLAICETACNRMMQVSYAAMNIIMHTAMHFAQLADCSIREKYSCFQSTITTMNVFCMGLPNTKIFKDCKFRRTLISLHVFEFESKMALTISSVVNTMKKRQRVAIMFIVKIF